MSSLLYQLYKGYLWEGLLMSYTMEDFRRDFRKEFLEELTPEECLEVAKRLSPEEILKALPREVIEGYLRRHPNGSSAAPSQGGGQPG
jgi:hypothetical protein